MEGVRKVRGRRRPGPAVRRATAANHASPPGGGVTVPGTAWVSGDDVKASSAALKDKEAMGLPAQLPHGLKDERRGGWASGGVRVHVHVSRDTHLLPPVGLETSGWRG